MAQPTPFAPPEAGPVRIERSVEGSFPVRAAAPPLPARAADDAWSAGRVAQLLALSATYFAAAKLSLMLAVVHKSATAVWPPTGIALAGLLIFGYRAWPAIALGAFVANITTSGSAATCLGIATGNTLEALAGAWLVNRFARGRSAFFAGRDAFRFAALASLVSPAISATVGCVSLVLGGSSSWERFGPIWVTWWLGDMGGAVVVAPMLIL